MCPNQDPSTDAGTIPKPPEGDRGCRGMASPIPGVWPDSGLPSMEERAGACSLGNPEQVASVCSRGPSPTNTLTGVGKHQEE